MRWGIAIVAILLVIGLVVVFVRPAPRWNPGTTGKFVAFVGTNGLSPGTNALLNFDHIPRENTAWHVIEISQLEGMTWRPWRPLPEPAFVWASGRSSNITSAFAAIVPLQTTSAPVRIVVELVQQPSKASSVMRTVRALIKSVLNRGRPLNTYLPFEGPTYWVTVEIRPGTEKSPAHDEVNRAEKDSKF